MSERSVGRGMAAVVGMAALVVGVVVGYLATGGLSGADVSQSGRFSYACALAEDIQRSHTFQDGKPVLEDPVWDKLLAIPMLLDLLGPEERKQGSPMADDTWGPVLSTVEVNAVQVDRALSATIDRCRGV